MSNKFPRKLKIPLTIISLILISYFLYNHNRPTYTDQFFFGAENKQVEKTNKFNETKKAEIDSLILTSVQNLPGRYGIFIKDLKANQTFEYKSNESFGSASIYKLAVMYKTYDSIEKGDLTKDSVLSAEKITLDRLIAGQNQNENQPENLETSKSVTLTVENALNAMITISDNYSALLLAGKLGWANIDQFLKLQSIPDFNLVGNNSPNITAFAVGNLLERIYLGTAINSQYSQEMKDFLFAQQINDRIPRYLPKDIKVGHKTGELESIRNDAGIVLGKKSDYIFVFLSETPKPEDAIENIALLSSKFYNALEE
ncbi:hypothetical protein A2164_03245 [Candidatus Curtissbacteria bacterium RBG_13_35_7]|uniref:Beta-lactamase class A catalytic domain-containing protein n=1 Tax=Candidatus Curtissbacteria bacterium RBG_13_35_7 TaxID=1797705 RepID=A0A1F5G392_9BACT|nr:MAG: hypothetical protein A2164_03245 [Candidatus Curtissbacteria bacterium RBG_13_35_7]